MKILISGPTLENANLVPLLSKTVYWQKANPQTKITILGTDQLKGQIDNLKIIKKSYRFIKIKKAGVIDSRIGLIFAGLKRNFWLIKNYQNFADFDVVYSISSVLDLVIFPYLLKRKNPQVVWATCFDNLVPITDPGNKLVRFLAWVFFQISLKMIKRADVVFTISPELVSFLIKKGVNKEKIILSSYGVETNLIKKAKRGRGYLFDALFVGRINETKGIYDMLEVLSLVKGVYPNFKLAIMGRGVGKTEKEYRQAIKEKGLVKNVSFLGFQTGAQKFATFQKSRCFWFLSKSDSESFGIALMEAVCCGLPAFTYDLPIYNRLYKNGEIITSPKGDYRSVAKKVLALFKKGNFSNQTGKNLLGCYSWDRVAKRELEKIQKQISN
jgi:glycosyltransferase involved in cell wall biosynthesis